MIAFWPHDANWPATPGVTFENRLTSIAVWSLAFIAAVMFAAYLLPALPPFDVRKGRTPPELPLATPWYFLPKSVEIRFQQPLVVVLVLTRSTRHSASSSRLRGRALGEVIRFAVLAAIFGFGFPYLILRVPNGFAYSYVLHLAYYATTVLMARIVVVGTESFLGFMICDNLTLNILQLIHPATPSPGGSSTVENGEPQDWPPTDFSARRHHLRPAVCLPLFSSEPGEKSCHPPSVLVHHLVPGHRKVVRLVMRATHEQSDETEPADVRHLFGVVRRDGQTHAVGKRFGRGDPAVHLIEFLGMIGDHPLNGGKGAALSRDGDRQAAVDRRRRRVCPQRYLVHVDQMLTQRFEIDLRPIGRGIGLQDADDFLNGAKGVLAWHGRRVHAHLHRPLAVHLHHMLHHAGHLVITRHGVIHHGHLLRKCRADRVNKGYAGQSRDGGGRRDDPGLAG
ncbi:hypothetical protein [Rhizobium leguminosarum]|uniref:hypothetical protein n=1 Tax=Rhizobium leguminosarum TaxID=384 RepID=UPI001C95A93C|nr:hypothetical protein [Rhizobium leguminosarum]MBY5435378.1 hypothetical protein [Rhizobium leguminosarum]